MRRLTILLLLVAVAGCLVLELDTRPWLQLIARLVTVAAFAAALLTFAYGLPRLSHDEDESGDAMRPSSSSSRPRARRVQQVTAQ